ncbi:hypothetical protein Ancab_004069 [Ancistrocladus abbreviatus]
MASSMPEKMKRRGSLPSCANLEIGKIWPEYDPNDLSYSLSANVITVKVVSISGVQILPVCFGQVVLLPVVCFCRNCDCSFFFCGCGQRVGDLAVSWSNMEEGGGQGDKFSVFQNLPVKIFYGPALEAYV